MPDAPSASRWSWDLTQDWCERNVLALKSVPPGWTVTPLVGPLRDVTGIGGYVAEHFTGVTDAAAAADVLLMMMMMILSPLLHLSKSPVESFIE